MRAVPRPDAATTRSPSSTGRPAPAAPGAPARDTARAPRLAGLDGIRFLAAAGVLAYHYTVRDSQAWGRPPSEMFPELGGWLVYAALGPELFFVISGFVILMTAWGRSVPDVVASRVARLFPAYWTCVLLTGALLLWIWPGGKDVTGGQVAVNLTMLQSLFGVGNVDGVYWTLWVELRFYVLVILLTAIGITRRRVLLFATLWPAAALVADAVGPGWLRTALVAQYAPLFAVGMLLYLVHREGHSRMLWALVAANTAAAVWLVVPDQLEQQLRNTGESPSGVLLGVLVVGCTVLVGAVTLTPAARVGWRWLTAAGALTYPLYLIHEHWGWWVIAHVHPAVPPWAALVLAAGFSLTLAAAVHHGVERRVGPRLRRAVHRGLERAWERADPRASARRRPDPAAAPRS